jgi:hypothetical protein
MIAAFCPPDVQPQSTGSPAATDRRVRCPPKAIGDKRLTFLLFAIRLHENGSELSADLAPPFLG